MIWKWQMGLLCLYELQYKMKFSSSLFIILPFLYCKRFYISWEALWDHPLWLAAPGFNLSWHSLEFSFGLQMKGLACSFLYSQDRKECFSALILLQAPSSYFAFSWSLTGRGKYDAACSVCIFLIIFLIGSLKVPKHPTTVPESHKWLSAESQLQVT